MLAKFKHTKVTLLPFFYFYIMGIRTDLQINCDLGEGVTQEESIYPYIDCASIACGGHTGDLQSIEESLHYCDRYKVKAGAHPSYPDRENFGRKSLKIPFSQLEESLLDQVKLFEKSIRKFQLNIDHIKFHGALYNDAAKDPILANQLCEFISKYYPKISLFLPPHSEVEKAALAKGLLIRREVFGDRRYQADYRLTSRTYSGALLSDLKEVEEQIDLLISHSTLRTDTGTYLPIRAETLCFHGDNPGIHTFLPIIRAKYWSAIP